MQKTFNSISDFIKLKDKCLFCEAPLRPRLCNFIGTHIDGLLILNEIIDSPRFKFEIRHTTQNYDIKANVTIDIITNKLVFTLPPNSNTPYLDQFVAKRAFIELDPHIGLYCSNKKCKNSYALLSCFLQIEKVPATVSWDISPLKLFIESFKTSRYVVENDWMKKETNIYIYNNVSIAPIKTPFINFETINKDKLINRIQTIVTFS